MGSEKNFDSCRKWMLRNARPLDIARWKYHFEGGGKENVLDALRAYQNSDGGFGHGLEADCMNPESAPIQTWYATEILREIDFVDSNSEIIKGILKYFESGKDYKDGYWLAEIPSNNAYPHAPWWSYSDDVMEEWGYNPTIALVGFILKFKDVDTELYRLADQIALKAVDDFFGKRTINDQHEISCFIRFCNYCREVGVTEKYNISEMEGNLREIVAELMCKDTEKWKTDYVSLPSNYVDSPQSIFYEDIKQLADYQNDFILESMNENGSFNINWTWGSYPEEWPISKNWWKANQCIVNMKYLKAFGRL